MMLVVGATGQLGGLITRSLLDRGDDVRAVVRDDASASALEAAGAQPVQGDLKDPESLRRACDGVDAVVTTANSAMRGGTDTVDTVDREGNRALVDAARAAGVRRFVFTSALGAAVDSPMPFMQAKAASETAVRESGMTWTVLQPNVFMDVWVPAVVGGPALAGRPVVLVGTGQRRHSFVAVRDVAAYAVAALTNPAAYDATLVIGGPDALTWPQVVETFAGVLGRDVPVEVLPPGEPVPGFPEVMNGLLAGMDTYDSVIDMTDVQGTYGVRPTSVAEFSRQLVASATAG